MENDHDIQRNIHARSIPDPKIFASILWPLRTILEGMEKTVDDVAESTGQTCIRRFSWVLATALPYAKKTCILRFAYIAADCECQLENRVYEQS